MAGFGGELLFFVGLGYVVLGPRRMQEVLHRLARARRDFARTREELASHLSTSIDSEESGPQP